jgi:vitamin B12 transporter
MRPFVSLAALLWTGVLAAPSLAAQQPRDTIRLEPIVVTATRLPTPLHALSAAATVLTGEELAARGIRTVAEALRLAPGVAVVQTGAFGAVTSLFLRGGESDYARVLVDGISINLPGGALDLAGLTTDAVDRIEIVRGPASVLYGSDAMTGVVQIFTRRGAGAPRLSAAARAGTYGTLEAQAELSEGTERTQLSVGWSRLSSDGLYQLNNRYRRAAAGGLVRFAPDAATELALTIRYTEGEFHFPTDGSGAVVDANQFNASRLTTLGLDATRRLSRRVAAKLLLGEHRSVARFWDGPDGPGDEEGGRSRARQERRSADARLDVRVGGGTIVTTGAVLEEQRVRSASAYETAFGPFGATADARRQNRAAYAQALADVAGRLFAQLGARVDDNQRFGSFTTVRAGLAWRAAALTRLSASYGTAFKEPTFDETFGSGFGDAGNPDLRPERARSFEIGLDHALPGGVAVSARWFDQRFRDMIQFTFAVPFGAPNYANVAGARSSGLEAEATWNAHPAITVAGRYTYLHTRATASGFDSLSFARDRRLLRRPAHSAALDASWRLSERGRLGATLLHVGERVDADFRSFPFSRVALPSYTRLDVSAEASLLRRSGGGLAATLKVENLAGASYQEVLGFPARGRSVLLGARLEGRF